MSRHRLPAEYHDVALMERTGYTEQEIGAMSIETRKRFDMYLYVKAKLR